MNRDGSSIAKISRPTISGILPRRRLFKLLDAGRKKPVTWISGPAGCGKTTLAASYLDDRKLPCIWYSVDGGDSDIAGFFYYMGLAARKAAPRIRKFLPLLAPEYLPDLPVFTRRYFEDLCARLKPPFTIVFDNYQDVPAGSRFPEIIASGIPAIPQGITMIVISRTGPPAAYARLRADERISVIASDELRFTEDEARGVLRRKGRRESPENLRVLLEKTQGWAAGLVLLTQRRGPAEASLLTRGDIASKEVFDYFAGEIFDKTDADTQRFLVQSVFLTSMTAQLAEQLTGNRSAGRILSHLYRNNYFTEMRPEREPVFHFHPLFREFLLSKAGALLPEQERNALQRKAAGFLQESGRIEDAALLFMDAGDHHALAKLTLDHAAELARTGRLQTIKSWLTALPSGVLDQSPWHRYWSGICLLGIDPQGARRELEQAFHAFSAHQDPHGTLLTWSLLVDSYFFEWNEFRPLDAWISLFFDSLQDMLRAANDDVRAKALTAIGVALMIRKPDHPDIKRFIDQASSLAARSSDGDIKIHALLLAIIYYSWIGDRARCNSLSEQIEGSLSTTTMLYSPYRLVSKVIQAGRQLWDATDIDRADSAVQEALDFGAGNGLHVWDHMLFGLGVNGSLVTGDLPKAERYLERMRHTQSPSRKETVVHNHMMCCWFHFLKGNLNRALVEAEAAVKLSDETGYVFADILCSYEMSQVLHAMNDGRADACLDRAFDLSVRTKSLILEFNCRIARAHYAFENGSEEAGPGLLREAFLLGRKEGFFSLLWWWDPVAMARLAARALEWGIEPDYVKELIRIRKLMPPEQPAYVENWPWPLKIYTLGTFRIEKESKPLVFAGKVQQKPLEMLKVLIALGGMSVRDEKIMEALWPDADGDVAFQSYETTLHRLRKLLGIEKAVVRSEGRITLDPALCWVDATAFERLLSESESHRGPAEPSSDEALRQLEKALSLYQGNFLGGEKEQPWLLSARERLRSRFMRAVARTGVLLEQAGRWEAVIEQYRKALEIDELAEEFYQRLIVCYGREDRRADVIAVYERCRKILTRTMGVEPSAGTTSLYKEILQRT